MGLSRDHGHDGDDHHHHHDADDCDHDDDEYDDHVDGYDKDDGDSDDDDNDDDFLVFEKISISDREFCLGAGRVSGSPKITKNKSSKKDLPDTSNTRHLGPCLGCIVEMGFGCCLGALPYLRFLKNKQVTYFFGLTCLGCYIPDSVLSCSLSAGAFT